MKPSALAAAVPAHWVGVHAVLMRGHGVASGTGANTPYPRSSIAMQKPLFAAQGLDLSAMFVGTLNLSIAPAQFDLHHPEHQFTQVRWTDLHPPETFSFARCVIARQASTSTGWVYYPHPQTKQAHFHNASLLEVLAPPLQDVRYGETLTVWLDPARVSITNP